MYLCIETTVHNRQTFLSFDRDITPVFPHYIWLWNSNGPGKGTSNSDGSIHKQKRLTIAVLQSKRSLTVIDTR